MSRASRSARTTTSPSPSSPESSSRAWGRCSGAWPRSPAARACQQRCPRTRRYLDLEIDEPAREVRRGTADLGLTRAEFDLLLALTEVPGVAWTRERLGDRVFGEAYDAFDRTIDSHVKNLRRKLGERAGGREYIETVRGVGYRAARE